MTNGRPLLLTIDDDPAIRYMVACIAREAGYECIEAGTPETIGKGIACNPDVIVLDMTMPDMDGNEVLWELVRRDSTSAVIISSGFFDACIHAAELYARKSGLNYVGRLDKPYPPSALSELLSSVRLECRHGVLSC